MLRWIGIGLWIVIGLLLPKQMLTAARPAVQPAAGIDAQRGWNFRFKKFVIGAWWGPGATDAELQLYREAGFNVVMTGRYMQSDSYGNPDEGLQELNLARKHGLAVMFDTYTKNDRPWGGKVGPTDSHPSHHPASLVELQWLYRRFASHPALIGFMIGDDQGSVSQRAGNCTQFLFEQPQPQLMPWLCGWIAPENLAAQHNPVDDPQIYPTLYQWNLPPTELARSYCESYAGFSRKCQESNVLFWPMLNTSDPSNGRREKDSFGYLPSDSLVRFPAYAALAYGAQGLWYFTYNGGAVEHEGMYRTLPEARAALTPLYPVVKEANLRIAAWGPDLLGRKSAGLFGTAFPPRANWPFPEDMAGSPSPEALAQPATGKLVREMSPDLLVGILVRPGRYPVAMVVDCRTSKGSGDLPDREAEVQFATAVSEIHPLGKERQTVTLRHGIRVRLQPGGGQALELRGGKRELERLCSPGAIYASPIHAPAAPRQMTPTDLKGVTAARLRIDVFGSDSRPEYSDKFIDFNGHRLGRAPSNDTDNWTMTTVEFTPEQLQWIGMSNEVTVSTRSADAWKFRNLTLALRLADGTWVKSNADTGVHSSPGWAFSEGQAWGADGVAGPVGLSLGN